MSLLTHTRTGIREMPSNAAWLLSKVVKPAKNVGDAAESAAAGTRDTGYKARAAIADATPLGGDSVHVRMRRAQDAGARAKEAEDQAVGAAQESRTLSDHARQVSERGRTQMRELERETDRQVKQRVASAQKAAEEAVRRERREAEAEAEERRREAQEEIQEEIQEAQREAEAAQQRAEELVAEATERLAEARQLATEAADAAREVAEQAHRQAQQLAEEAEQQASSADAQVRAAEQLRAQSQAAAKDTARKLQRDGTGGDLGSYNKPELLELAASIGIEGRTTMTKTELVNAIEKASRRAS